MLENMTDGQIFSTHVEMNRVFPKPEIVPPNFLYARGDEPPHIALSED